MNNRKLVLYNAPFNCIQFELVPARVPTELSKAYVQLANYANDQINWHNSVSVELTLSIVIDLVVILHNLRGTRTFDKLGSSQQKRFKFGFGSSEHYGYGLWLELNKSKPGGSDQMKKPRLLLTVSGRLGDIISLKAFVIGVLNTYLLERTGTTYTVSEIINQLVNPPAISSLEQSTQL